MADPAPLLSRYAAIVPLLRIEALAVTVFAVLAYHWCGGGWVLFVLLAFAPDVAIAAYWAGPRTGALVYNAAHTTVAPAVLAAAGLAAHRKLLVLLALIWLAHIGFDRLLGFGLKLTDRFGQSHLGPFRA